MNRKLKIAIEGCGHGDLDAIYSAIANLEERNQYKVDLLLMCGDFEAMRNYADLECTICPQKYKILKDFHKYYSGQKKAPIPTIVIGGNHEASNYMHELYHGGWLAPDFYFLGNGGSVIVNGIRISGASGLHNPRHFKLGLHEKLPYDRDAMESIYHTREFTIRRLSFLPQPHIFLSHEWPVDITSFGKTHATPNLSLQALLKRRPDFKPDINRGQLGSAPLMGLLKKLKPQWWFSAHMHIRFEGEVIHNADGTVSPPSPRGTSAGAMQEKNTAQPRSACSTTKFIALDKCLPKRKFLEIIEINPATPGSDPTIPISTYPSSPEEPLRFSFDPHWLAITRVFQPHLSTLRSKTPSSLPTDDQVRGMLEKELKWVMENVPRKLAASRAAAGGDSGATTSVVAGENGGGTWEVAKCQNFVVTAPVERNAGNGRKIPPGSKQPPWYLNPQTKAFTEMLEIEDKINKHQTGEL